MHRHALAALALLALAHPATAQTPDTTGYSAAECPPCAGWNAARAPFRIHGNTWYVGTEGLSALLVTSPEGHVLLDAGLPESAPRIIANIRALGFRAEDVKLIVNSHAHYDHAGGTAALQRVSGATVAALPWSAAVMRTGRALPDDPQFNIALPFPAVREVREIRDGETLRVGPIAVTAHFTGGHTPGGTTWSWRACEGDRCLDIVYADSQTPISDDDFTFTRSTRYPAAIRDFERGHAVLERLACDVLVTAHPGFSELFERQAAREQGRQDAFRRPGACREYAAWARQRLAERLERERAGR